MIIMVAWRWLQHQGAGLVIDRVGRRLDPYPGWFRRCEVDRPRLFFRMPDPVIDLDARHAIRAAHRLEM
jgi:hypothetical protein